MTDAIVSSAVVRVTLFEDRAEVVRAAKAELSRGSGKVVLAGLSPFIDEGSIQAKAAGPAKVTAARVRVKAHEERALGREAIDALEREAADAKRAESSASSAIERANRSEGRARELLEKWIEGASIVPKGAREEETAEAWKASLRSIDGTMESALDRASVAREQKSRATAEHARTAARLAEGSVIEPRFEGQIEIDVEMEHDASIDLEVTYRVACALWRPEHLIRCSDAADGAIEITTIATAWQRTGEVWDGIDLRFSTARPARAASPPLLHDDVLSVRRRTDAERKRVQVEMREQQMTVAGLDRGARAVDEMPGVDDGGVPLTLTAREKVTIAGDGRPFRVELATVKLAAAIERVVFPEIATVAHYRATATLIDGGPLLAGPVRIARGTSLVGRSAIDFVGKGEPFEVGLGIDSGVRVRRTVEEQRDTATVTGKQRIRRLVKVFLSNLAHEAKKLVVTERVPVSEIEDVEIKLLEAGGWDDLEDGLLRRELTLLPSRIKTLELSYEIRAASKVVLPF